MKKIRVAIIGQGRSGRDIHGAYLIQDPSRYKIIAVTDILKDRRERAARKFHCDVYRDYGELFKRKDIDLIVNTTPTYLSVPIILDILKAGYNCLAEKPLAGNVKDIDKLTAAAKKSRKTLTQAALLEVTLQQVRLQTAIIEECQRQNPHIYDRTYLEQLPAEGGYYVETYRSQEKIAKTTLAVKAKL